MAPRKKEEEKRVPKRPPATTPEGRERQLISAAIDLAEKQLMEGTASSQVVTHYLKLGSSREKLEQERLVEENRLLRIKADAIESQKRVEDLYARALDAMRSYAGQPPLEDEEALEYREER